MGNLGPGLWVFVSWLVTGTPNMLIDPDIRMERNRSRVEVRW